MQLFWTLYNIKKRSLIFFDIHIYNFQNILITYPLLHIYVSQIKLIAQMQLIMYYKKFVRIKFEY